MLFVVRSPGPTGSVLAEMLRENKRLIDKSIREIDRERNSLQTQERKLIDEMKKNAKQGQMVRLRLEFPQPYLHLECPAVVSPRTCDFKHLCVSHFC